MISVYTITTSVAVTEHQSDTDKKQDCHTLFKAKYCARVAAVSSHKKCKKITHVTLTYDLEIQ